MKRYFLYPWAVALAGAALGSGYGTLAPRTPATAAVAVEPAPVRPPVAPTQTPAPTSVVAPTPPKPPKLLKPRGDVDISSEGGFEYDGETGRVIYKGKVQVLDPANDPRTIITCDWLTTILPPAGGKVGEIIALTNVMIRVKDEKGAQTATGAKAVFNATNDTITITGHPVVELPSGTLFGDQYVVYNRLTEKFEAPGRIRMVARPGTSFPIPGFSPTNTPSSKTNVVAPPPTKSQP